MKSKVDTGKIIDVIRFPIERKLTVKELSFETYKAMHTMFDDLVQYIIKYDSLPKCSEKWLRKPYKRSELEQLSTITINMTKAEIDKRIRSTYFPGKPAPYISFNNHKFEYNPDR